MKYRKDLEEYYLLHKILNKEQLPPDSKYVENYKKFLKSLLIHKNIFKYFYKNNTSGNIFIKKEIFDIKSREFSIFNNEFTLFLPNQNTKVNFNALEFENFTDEDKIDIETFIEKFINDEPLGLIKTKKRVFSNKDFFNSKNLDENVNNDYFDLQELFKFKYINHKNFKYYKIIFDVLRSKIFFLHEKSCYVQKNKNNSNQKINFKTLVSKESILNHNNNHNIKKAIRLILNNFKVIKYKNFNVLDNNKVNYTSIKTEINFNNNNFNKSYINYNNFLENKYFSDLQKKEITDFISKNRSSINFIHINENEIYIPYENFFKILTKYENIDNKDENDIIIQKLKSFFRKKREPFYSIIRENKVITNGKIFNFFKSKYEFLKSEEELKKENDIKDGTFKLKKDKRLKEELITIKKDIEEAKKIYKKDWIGSVDTEYNISNNQAVIYEIGYTLKNIKNKKLISRHFIIKDNMRIGRQIKSFNFGLSEVVDLDFAFKEMKKDLKNVKMIIGNSIDSDKKMLELAGFAIPDEILFELNNFPTYFEKKKNQYDLETFLIYANMKYSNLHNAGNDSYYSVRTFIDLMTKYSNQTFTDGDLSNIKKSSENGLRPKKGFNVINKLKKRKHIYMKKQFNDDLYFKEKDITDMKFTELFLLFDIKNAIFNTYIKEKKIKKKMQKIEAINFLRTELERFINKEKLNFAFEKKVPFCDLDSIIEIFKHFKNTLIISEYNWNEIFKIRSKFSNFLEEPKKNEIIFVDLEDINEEENEKFKTIERKIKQENIKYQKKFKKIRSDEDYTLF